MVDSDGTGARARAGPAVLCHGRARRRCYVRLLSWCRAAVCAGSRVGRISGPGHIDVGPGGCRAPGPL